MTQLYFEMKTNHFNLEYLNSTLTIEYTGQQSLKVTEHQIDNLGLLLNNLEHKIKEKDSRVVINHFVLDDLTLRETTNSISINNSFTIHKDYLEELNNLVGHAYFLLNNLLVKKPDYSEVEEAYNE